MPGKVKKTEPVLRQPGSGSAALLSGPYLVWMLIFVLIPLAVVVYYAFTGTDGSFTLANIASIGEYFPVVIDSVWLAAIATFICLILAYPFAYMLTRTSPSTQRIIIMLCMLPMCMSFLLRTLSWVEILKDNGIINTFLSSLGFGKLRLIRTRAAVVLGMVYNYLPYMILPLYTILSKLDRRLVEAAQDLGCSGVTVFSKVVIPLSVPGIISGITMVFVPAVSTFYIAQKLGGTDMYMIGDHIERLFKKQQNGFNAGAAMSLLLMAIVFISMWIMGRYTGNDEEV